MVAVDVVGRAVCCCCICCVVGVGFALETVMLTVCVVVAKRAKVGR